MTKLRFRHAHNIIVYGDNGIILAEGKTVGSHTLKEIMVVMNNTFRIGMVYDYNMNHILAPHGVQLKPRGKGEIRRIQIITTFTKG